MPTDTSPEALADKFLNELPHAAMRADIARLIRVERRRCARVANSVAREGANGKDIPWEAAAIKARILILALNHPRKRSRKVQK